MADTLSSVTTLDRTLLDDDQADVYTDTVLLPSVNASYRWLQRKLAENGVSVLSDTVVLSPDLTAVTGTKVGSSTSPALPTDLLVPWQLKEKAAGTTDQFSDMRQVNDLPEQDQGTQLLYWEWRAGEIRFLGATGAVTLKLKYEKVLPNLSTPSSVIGITSGVDAIAYKSASIVSRARGQAQYSKDLAQAANEELDDLINLNVRAQQRLPRRRRAYGMRGFPLY